MRRIKTFVMDLPMKLKLSLLCFLLVVFSTFLLTSVVYIYTAGMIKSDTERYTDEVMLQSGNYLDEKMRGILQKTNYMQLNPDFIRIMKSILYKEKDSYVDETSRITDIISQIKSGEELVESVYVSAKNHTFYNFDSGIAKTTDFEGTGLYGEIVDKKRIYWGTAGENELLNSRVEVIPMVLPVTIYKEQFDDAFIILNLNADVLKRQLDEIGDNLGGIVYIRNEAGDLVITSGGGKEKAGEILAAEEAGRAKNYQISRSGLRVNGWEIGCIQSNRSLLARVNTLRNFMVGIAVFCVVLFAIVAGMLADSITRPLKKLQELMEQAVKMEFRQEFNVRYRDEVGHLALGFNEMCHRIRSLMRQVEEEEEQKRKAELQALNAQINPHFLYNTLDCIYWTSMKDGNQDIAEVALNISNVFRLGLNKGRETTTVEREVRHAVSYMRVQKVIYKGKFDFQVYCQQDLKDCEIIKLILQPLVENSILHGFNNMECGGEIFIEARGDGEFIQFKVSDNGCGIDESAAEASGREDGGLALENIRTRLKLHYQDQASLRLSQEGEGGTTVTVRIPYVR